jgi:MinD-like ATPase involved in chromosome partitioning or flagellar assembly
MYVTTFYSYKGGVGRTLALANVATHLVRRGRRVLLIDFDLEAPGLDTFALFRPDKPTPGIVEYVSHYLAFHETADVSDYTYEVTLPNRELDQTAHERNGLISPELNREDLSTDEPKDAGRLWVMPAGRRDQSYSKLLQDIDWGVLYAEHSGYLMFEDLKEQWRDTFNPDYVLIDSRTGHTDVGGICTRHLPDAVALLFFPNEQNLRGLEGVVTDIRDESKPPRNKQISLHFIMSNVPDLDDEDRIVSDLRAKFEKTLGFKRALLIHNYNSLALLNQTIFCEERPRSRLAGEYRQFAQEIIRSNPKDKEGALIFLSRYAAERRRGALSALDAETMLQSIQTEYANDGDIQTHLAFLRMEEGSHEDARRTLERAIEMDISSPQTLARRAQCRLLFLKDETGAEADAIRALRQSKISETDAGRTFRMLAELQRRQALREAAQLPTVDLFPVAVRLFIGTRLNREIEDLPVGIKILKSVMADSGLEDRQRRAAIEKLILALIGAGAFSEVCSLLENVDATSDNEIAFTFNYAMARWAMSGVCDKSLFQKVINLDPDGPNESLGANYAQCMAIAHWATKDHEIANEFLALTESIVDGSEFSCWNYLEVDEEIFRAHTHEIRRMFGGEDLLPEFFYGEKRRSLDS